MLSEPTFTQPVPCQRKLICVVTCMIIIAFTRQFDTQSGTIFFLVYRNRIIYYSLYIAAIGSMWTFWDKIFFKIQQLDMSIKAIQTWKALSIHANICLIQEAGLVWWWWQELEFEQSTVGFWAASCLNYCSEWCRTWLR